MANRYWKIRKRGSGECSNFRLVEHAALEFMSIVPDDLLMEILLRLPDARSVLLSTTVCKRWCSLIQSPKFSFPRRFIEFHKDHTFSILFKFSRFKRKPYHQLSSNGCRPYDLSFIPNSPKLVTRASSGDLLLLSEGNRRFFICNSLTKLSFPLPEVPPIHNFTPSRNSTFRTSSGFALVRRHSDAQQLGRYRVVLVYATSFVSNRFHCNMTVFDSEAGIWTWSNPALPYRCPSWSTSPGINLEILNPGDGAVYWLDGQYRNYAGLVSLDAFSMKLRLIPLPQGEFKGLRRLKAKERVRGGVVRGRVRLSRTVEEENGFGLRVWELDSRDDRWSLLHDVNIVPPTEREMLFFVVGFDPNDGDSVFVELGTQGIFRYQIAKDKYVKICDFPTCGMSIEKLKKRVGRYLKVLNLVHPFWPTAIPPSQPNLI